MPPARPRVLVVEDDGKTSQWLTLYLERDGMRVEVAGDGPSALTAIDRDVPDIVLLDVMLPGLNGFEVCRAIRAVSRVPVLLVTAREAEDDRLRGFDAGADDYITKPFSPREVVARVRAVLRRSAPTDEPASASVGLLTLRADSLSLDVNGATVRLTPIEARLLQTLMAAPNRVWTRAQLVERVLGQDYDGSERTIDAHVKNLRRKIDAVAPADGRLPRIATTHGVGYRLEVVHA